MNYHQERNFQKGSVNYFDGDRRLWQVYQENSNGSQGNHNASYAYNDLDQETEYLAYNSNGSVHIDRSNTYNPDGTVQKVHSIINDGGTDTDAVYTYDGAGNPASSTSPKSTAAARSATTATATR